MSLKTICNLAPINTTTLESLLVLKQSQELNNYQCNNQSIYPNFIKLTLQSSLITSLKFLKIKLTIQVEKHILSSEEYVIHSKSHNH